MEEEGSERRERGGEEEEEHRGTKRRKPDRLGVGEEEGEEGEVEEGKRVSGPRPPPPHWHTYAVCQTPSKSFDCLFVCLLPFGNRQSRRRGEALVSTTAIGQQQPGPCHPAFLLLPLAFAEHRPLHDSAPTSSSLCDGRPTPCVVRLVLLQSRVSRSAGFGDTEHLQSVSWSALDASVEANLSRGGSKGGLRRTEAG